MRRFLIRLAVGLAISALFIWLALRDKDPAAMWEAMREADYRYLGVYVGVLFVIHFLRTLRWGLLLEPVGRIRFGRLNRACAIGFMALILLPFRLGELARPFLVSRPGEAEEGESPIRMSAAMASIVIERIVDGLSVAAILMVTLLVTAPDQVGDDIEYVRAGGYALFGVFGGALLVVLFVFWQRERALALVRRLVTPVSAALAERLASLISSFIGAFGMLPSWPKFALFLLLTWSYWAVNGAGMLLLGYGFGLELGLIEMYTVLGVLVIGVMIPAGPGMLGTFQFFALLGLSLFVPKATLDGAGVAWANVLWGTQFLQMVGFGLVFLLAGQLSLRTLVDAGEGEG